MGRNSLYGTGQLQNCKLYLGTSEDFSLSCRTEGKILILGIEQVTGVAFKAGLIFVVPKAHSLHPMSQVRSITLAVLSTI